MNAETISGRNAEHQPGPVADIPAGTAGAWTTAPRRKKLAYAALAVLVAGVCGACWTAKHYVVRTAQGVVLVEKRFLALGGTCVDVRGWTHADYASHPELRHVLMSQGYADLVPQPPAPPAPDLAEQWERIWTRTCDLTARTTYAAGSAVENMLVRWESALE